MELKSYYLSLQIVLALSSVDTNTNLDQSCNACCQGLPGAAGRDGVPGRDGIGRDGRDGVQGNGGSKGDKGDVGFGEQSLPRPAGPIGERGLRGFPGKVGPAGGIGLIGLTGEVGMKGRKGESRDARQSAFSAQKTSTQTSTVTREIVSFDEARVNVGGHFDLTTNRFVCQIPGLYFFSFSLYGTRSSPDAILRKDGHIIAWARSASDNIDVSISSSTLIQLQPGNAVWMEFSSAGETFEGTRNGQFNGVLVYGE